MKQKDNRLDMKLRAAYKALCDECEITVEEARLNKLTIADLNWLVDYNKQVEGPDYWQHDC